MNKYGQFLLNFPWFIFIFYKFVTKLTIINIFISLCVLYKQIAQKTICRMKLHIHYLRSFVVYPSAFKSGNIDCATVTQKTNLYKHICIWQAKNIAKHEEHSILYREMYMCSLDVGIA